MTACVWPQHPFFWLLWVTQEVTVSEHSGAPLYPQTDATSPAAEAHGQLCPGNPVCRGSTHPASGLLLSGDPGEPTTWDLSPVDLI